MKRNTPSRVALVRDVKRYRIEDLQYEEFRFSKPDEEYVIYLSERCGHVFLDVTDADPVVFRMHALKLRRLADRLSEIHLGVARRAPFPFPDASCVPSLRPQAISAGRSRH